MGSAVTWARDCAAEWWADTKAGLAVVWQARAEILHAGSIVGGWALLTAGVARLLVPEVWLISGGLLLLSFAGWGHLRRLVVIGLYALTRRERG